MFLIKARNYRIMKLELESCGIFKTMTTLFISQ